jgi:septum formation protein
MRRRTIYLASRSVARQRLLEVFGLPVKVIPSGVIEKRAAAGSFSRLVKDNAFKKAQQVARQVKSGIIIGADTITVQGKNIFGKPKNIKQAKQAVKKLSGKPAWVYTGVAVIDADKGKTLIDYVRTKVYMSKLTDKEINDYFSCVSPLDKAGSFDIQGRGAFFIPQIEGCFYNVVGLPLAKLYQMLKRIGVNL